MYLIDSLRSNYNLYALSLGTLNDFTAKLWDSNIWDGFLKKYGDTASLVYNIIQFPFDLATYDEDFKLTSPFLYLSEASDGIHIGDSDLIKPIQGASDPPYRVFGTHDDKAMSTYIFTASKLSTILSKSFIDYSTFTTYLLYLPYIGYVQLDHEAIIEGHNLVIEYTMDVSTGCLSAITYSQIGITKYRIREDKTNVGTSMPISGSNASVLRDGLINIASSFISTAGILSGKPYLSIASNAVKTATLSNKTTVTTRNPKTGRQITAGTNTYEGTATTNDRGTEERYMSKNSAYGTIFSGLANLTNCQLPTTVRISKDYSDAYTSYDRPFLLIRRPHTHYSNGFDSLFGRPLNEYKKLKELKGYTQVSSTHINISATTNEINEIEQLLYEGVILNTDVEIPDTPIVTPTPPPDIPVETDPIITPQPTLPEGEVATMLCCFNGKFRVSGMRGKPSDTGRPRNHYGLDLVGLVPDENNQVTVYQKVYAISSGWVKLTDEGDRNLGKCVHVQMDSQNYYGEWILYGHLSKFEVKNGQYVEKGQLIGIMGNTGASDGWHTHLEWRNKYDKYDPDFTKYDICKFTGIPNTSVEGQNTHIGSPIYKTANGASVQSKLGIENQTIEYLENYKYADDLMKKIDEHTK